MVKRLRNRLGTHIGIPGMRSGNLWEDNRKAVGSVCRNGFGSKPFLSTYLDFSPRFTGSSGTRTVGRENSLGSIQSFSSRVQKSAAKF